MVKIKKKASMPQEDGVGAKATMSTRERMLARKKQLSEKNSNHGIIFPKEGTMRVRLMSQGPDQELGLEVIQFYLGQKIGGVISPATFDEPCPIMEKYRELKNSSDEDDQQVAKLLVPRRRYIIGGTIYKDEKGKEVDPDKVCKPILVPSSVYQSIIDLYLDEDDWGDMTDPEEGYDIKITRSGKGKMDTSYAVIGCPGKKALPSQFVKEMDLSKIIHSQVKPYDELEEILNEYLQTSPAGDDETPVVKKKRRTKPVDEEGEELPF